MDLSICDVVGSQGVLIYEIQVSYGVGGSGPSGEDGEPG